jgi:hypothetical protein
MAEAEYWRFTVLLRGTAKRKNTSESHSQYKLSTKLPLVLPVLPYRSYTPGRVTQQGPDWVAPAPADHMAAPPCSFTREEVLELRRSLVDDGFCIVPSLMPTAMVERVREWSDALLDDPGHPEWSVKFQGDVEFVQSPRKAAGNQARANSTNHSSHPIIEEIFDLPAAKAVADAIGLENMHSDDETVILLSKYPGAPPLYWCARPGAPRPRWASCAHGLTAAPLRHRHQDLMNWDHAIAATPWPTRIFLNYYTVDTTKDNGCLRIIPGAQLGRGGRPAPPHLPPAAPY